MENHGIYFLYLYHFSPLVEVSNHEQSIATNLYEADFCEKQSIVSSYCESEEYVIRDSFHSWLHITF